MCNKGDNAMNITVTIDDAEIRAKLKELQARLGNLKPVMTRIGLFYEESVRKNFDNQSDASGKPWPKLAATTLMLGLGHKKGFKKRGTLSVKGKKYLQGKQTLVESHDLKTSIHSQAGANSVTIGTGGHIKYAAIHQFGGPAGRGRKVKIPPRPFLAINRGKSMVLAEKDKKMIMELLEEELNRVS